jgi:hypothetical protein
MRASQSVACAVCFLTAFANPLFLKANAGTPYEAKIGGFMVAILNTLITGEFAGRGPSNADAALSRPVCKAGDYDELRAVTSQSDLDALRRKCRLVATQRDAKHVYATAYLPPGTCLALKSAFESVLAVHVKSKELGDIVVFEYKGSRYNASARNLTRKVSFDAVCEDDGALRVSTRRKL